MGKFLTEKRKLLDAKDVSIKEIIQHSFINLLYGFNSGVVIGFVTLFIKDVSVCSAAKLFVMYFIHKQVESKVLNRNKYITKLGRNYIFPIPSTIGFVLGAYISTILN